jgi:hypothetical protein
MDHWVGFKTKHKEMKFVRLRRKTLPVTLSRMGETALGVLISFVFSSLAITRLPLGWILPRNSYNSLAE